MGGFFFNDTATTEIYTLSLHDALLISKGPSQEAYQKLREKLPIGWYYTMYLNPLPTSLLEELRQKELVLVPELNYQGQWSSILRSQGVNAESITQYTGLPFKVSDLIDRIEDRINSYTERKVKA